MQVSSFQNLIKHVTFDRTPRVWSLLVTVFGELAQDSDARISGSLLRKLSDHIGIKPEAMRVALHRLRKDGWIDSERTGRTSEYFLTPWGRAQTIAASPRIYAKGPAATDAWLVTFNPAHPTPDDHSCGAWVASNLLVTSVCPDNADSLAQKLTAAAPLPAWVTDKVCDADTIDLSQDFLTALTALPGLLGDDPGLTPMQTTALRILLVHGWRRIVLKAPVLPDHVFPDTWRGQDCRCRTSKFLDQLPKQNLSRLEAGLITDAPRLST